jgi:hypothetical protein
MKIGLVQPLKRGEEIVPQVVLEVTRCADDEAARQETEEPANGGQNEEQCGVQPDLASGDRLVQIVDGVLEDPRSRQQE